MDCEVGTNATRIYNFGPVSNDFEREALSEMLHFRVSARKLHLALFCTSAAIATGATPRVAHANRPLQLPPFPRSFSSKMGSADVAIAPASETLAQKSDLTKEKFKAVFPDLVELLIADLSSQYELPEDSIAYIRKNLTYNVPHGKLNRGLAVYQCYKAFRSDPNSITAAEERKANLLGWCVELLQAYFLVADDIMDDSITRRGQPCFFRIPEIGMNAINDAMILEMMIFRVLRLQFRDHPAYVDLVELFQDITYTTEMGQLLDLTSQDDGPVQLDRFTDEVLARIYKYKTSHYTFYLPVALGMHLAGVKERAHFDTAKKVCLELGHYFQAQDDFLDAFGDPEVTGKVGTDIEENTCTWLIVQALKVAGEGEMRILNDNYGKKEKKNSDAVKEVYRQLGVPEMFAKFEQDSFERMRGIIDGVDDMPTGAFEFLLAKIYKRSK